MEAAIADTVAGVGKAKNIYTKEDNLKNPKTEKLPCLHFYKTLRPFPALLICTVLGIVVGVGKAKNIYIQKKPF